MIFEFLKYCLGNKMLGSEMVARMDWRELYSFASKQALLGFCFDGVERLGKECPDGIRKNPIERALLMEWMGKVQQIRQQNMRVNVVAVKVLSQLHGDGLRCCVLKGQGNAMMYPNPFSRTPGDIDVWVNDSRERIMEYAKSHFTLSDDIRFQHTETMVDGISVELHFVPAVMNNPVFNRRLQKWFGENVELQCSNVINLPAEAGTIAVPTPSFNAIYQLCHLYHHFFDEGIGMRQIVDYYYVMLELSATLENTNKDIQRSLKHLGLWNFAGAVMYVLHEALGLPEDKMIRGVDVKRGKLLLSEIVNGGNFGRHYTKYGHFTQQGMAVKYFLKIWRNMHFVRYFPAEALSEPIFRTWHFFWRMKNVKK